MGEFKLVAEPKMPTIQITRTFEAPRDKVFKAYTDPELIPKWWGPAYLTTTIDKHDARSGGAWRYIHTDPEGKQYSFHGVFHDVTAPERLIGTFEFEGLPEPGHVELDKAIFIEKDGQTTITITSVFTSVEDRDGMISSGMEGGMKEGFDRLEALLEKA